MANGYAGGKTKDAKWNFGKKGWMIIILGLLAYVVYMGFDNGLNYIVPAYAGLLNVSSTVLMLFSTIGGWIQIAAIILAGILQEKLGVKRTLILSLTISLVGGAIWAFAQNVAMYAIGVILVKATGGVYTMVSFAEIGANWFPTKKGIYMGIITVGVVLGAFISNGPMGIVIMNAGVTKGMMILVILNAIELVLCAILAKTHPEESGAYPDNDKSMTPEQAQAHLEKVKEYQKSSQWTIGKCLRSKTVWTLGIGLGMMLCIATGVLAQLVPSAQSFGHSAAVAQMAGLIPAPFALAGTLLAGVLDQKIGTKKVTILICIVAIVGLSIGAFLGQLVPCIFICSACLSLAMSGGNNMIMSFSSTIFGRYDFSTPFMVVLVICQFISAFGYIIVSALAEAYTTYKICFLVGAIMIFVAMVLIILTSDKFLGRKDSEVN